MNYQQTITQLSIMNDDGFNTLATIRFFKLPWAWKGYENGCYKWNGFICKYYNHYMKNFLFCLFFFFCKDYMRASNDKDIWDMYTKQMPFSSNRLCKHLCQDSHILRTLVNVHQLIYLTWKKTDVENTAFFKIIKLIFCYLAKN